MLLRLGFHVSPSKSRGVLYGFDSQISARLRRWCGILCRSKAKEFKSVSPKTRTIAIGCAILVVGVILALWLR
jgi:hypothetical protein